MLEQLAVTPVPPVPTGPRFTAGVRRKLHPRLLSLHVLEFAVGGMLWSLMHMAAALAAAAVYTITGTWPATPGDTGHDGSVGGGRTGP